MTASPLHAPSMVLAVIATAVVVNAAQFPALEMGTSQPHEAVRIKSDHDLRSLVAGHFDSTRERFELYVQLREVAAGVAVTLPPMTGVPGEHLLGLSMASVLTHEQYDTAVSAEVAAGLEAAAVAGGTDRHLGSYVIALADDQVEELVLVTGPQRSYLADRRLLEQLGSSVAP